MSAKNGSNGADTASKRIHNPRKPPLPEAYFDSYKQHYWVQDQRTHWMPYNETSLKRLLKSVGFSSKPARGAVISAVDMGILEVQHGRNVDYAASLAGYQKGVYEILGKRVLVVDSPALVEAEEGSWDTLRLLIDGLLGDPDHEQASYLFGWLKVALESLRAGKRRPGQALVLAGPKDCGKSLLQKIITKLLGGRMASPYQYMMGTTPFNGEMFKSEHLVIEDNPASTDIRARRSFGAMLKTITFNDDQPCFDKGRRTVSLTPFWRLSISVNDEPENLMVLPPMDNSMQDKVMLLRAYSHPLPMPTITDEERELFWGTITSELPAFVHFLFDWEIPEHLKHHRTGILAWQHPELLQILDDLAPEKQLLDIIDGELFGGVLPEEWEGRAEELSQRLMGKDSGSSYAARNLLGFRTACGTYLGRLAKKHPERITKKVRDGYTIWKVQPPKPVSQ